MEIPQAPSARPRVALTLAGSDSGGGAGVQADLRTFAAFGVVGTSALTAVTAQNTADVAGVLEVPPEFVLLQARAVLADIAVDALKTGMLSSSGVVAAACALVRDVRAGRFGKPAWVVVDPVMVAKGGASLLRPDALEAMRVDLAPLADVLTPNLPEAAALLGLAPEAACRWTRREREEAARELCGRGARAVLLKGGHAVGDELAADVLVDGRATCWLESPWVDTPHVHGTGCTLSAAITAGLARGTDVATACASAKRFLVRALETALPLGRRGSPNQLHALVPWEDG